MKMAARIILILPFKQNVIAHSNMEEIPHFLMFFMKNWGLHYRVLCFDNYIDPRKQFLVIQATALCHYFLSEVFGFFSLIFSANFSLQ